jgi:hypothetical protein
MPTTGIVHHSTPPGPKTLNFSHSNLPAACWVKLSRNQAAFKAESTNPLSRNFSEGFVRRRGKTNTTIHRRNEAPAKLKENKMKTRTLLLTISAAALTAITFNATAADTLLTPRATGNQIKTVAGSNNDQNLVNTTGTTVSPRAASNQIKTVAGTSSEVNLTTLCASHMQGSPKSIQDCAANAAICVSMGCCASMAGK